MAFGDAEAAVAAILRADDRVAAFTPTVACNLVGYQTGDRWLLVSRTGGVPVHWMRKDNPRIRIAAYAEDQGTAFDLADAARDAIYAARGAYEGHGLGLYDVADEQGLTWDPDNENPDLARYLFALSLVTTRAGQP